MIVTVLLFSQFLFQLSFLSSIPCCATLSLQTGESDIWRRALGPREVQHRCAHGARAPYPAHEGGDDGARDENQGALRQTARGVTSGRL